MVVRVLAVLPLVLTACTSEPSVDPPIDPPVDPPIDPPQPRTVTVTLDELRPNDRVTTSRFLDSTAPGEQTIISDGSPLTITGSDRDVFVATVTDSDGVLRSTHSMSAHCALANARRLEVPRDYATIQAAIDAANPGDTVRVAAGTYTESIKLRPNVCLLGMGAKRTILDAQAEGRTLVDLTNAPGSLVAGFTIRNSQPKPGCANQDVFTCSGNWYTAGIYLGNDGTLGWENPTINAPPIITNNVFEGNYIGVMLYFHGIAVIRNNVFANNRTGFVANHYQDRTLVANNVFVNNAELAIGNQAAYLDIVDNVIAGSDVGIRFMYIQTGHILCNVFYANGENQRDDYINPPRFAIGDDGNVEAEPKFVGNGDWHLLDGSPAKGTGCHGHSVMQPHSQLPDRGTFGGSLAAWTDL